MFSDSPDRNGWIPDAVEMSEAHSQGRVSEIEKLEALAVPWDVITQPTVTTYESYEPYLKMSAEVMDDLRAAGEYKPWWESVSAETLERLFISSQGNIGSCAGVALYDRCYQMMLLTQINRGSEQIAEPVNSMVTWLISKGGVRSGGQTISAVLNYGAMWGVYPVSSVGEYDPAMKYNRAWLDLKSMAAERQIGSAIISGDKAEAILLACRAGHTVLVGNSQAVMDGVQRDSNGMQCVRLHGVWSHATAFGGWKKVNGCEYVWWGNSHGERYPSSDGTPAWGAWMREDTLNDFCLGRWCDAAVITHVEAPYGPARRNLNP